MGSKVDNPTGIPAENEVNLIRMDKVCLWGGMNIGEHFYLAARGSCMPSIQKQGFPAHSFPLCTGTVASTWVQEKHSRQFNRGKLFHQTSLSSGRNIS
ncbi:MAG: hypothetical protein DRP87_02160 [Spirochaetes bacterium]|nr:MAG: hypothetical protein DRP87_02160 [Spirochaetota bacterium]